ncbi:MAG: hypothetical protein AB1938_03225 [Myxococcota bacterium]
MRATLVLMLVLGCIGCLTPVRETMLGDADGGVDGGATGGGGGATGGGGGGTTGGGTGGGATGGGGGATGGGGGSDAGSFVVPDGGLIAPVMGGPAECMDHEPLAKFLAARVGQDAGCANGCMLELVETGFNVLMRGGAAPEDLKPWFSVATSEDWHAFTASASGAAPQRVLLAAPLAGGALQVVEVLPDSVQQVDGLFFQGKLHYILRANGGTPSETNTLKVWDASTFTTRTQLMLPGPLDKGFGVSSFAGLYVLSLAGGIYTVGLYQNPSWSQIYAGTDVIALNVEDVGRVSFATPAGIHSMELGSTAPSLISPMPASALLEWRSGELAVLNDYGLWLVSTTGTAAPRLLYAQQDFPQGYRWLRGLRKDSQALYVGQICYPDADSPGYGTLKVVPPSVPGAVPSFPGSASWVTGTTDWPWRTPVLDGAAWDVEPVEHTRNDGIIHYHVGP